MADEPKRVVERFLREGRDRVTGHWRLDVINECFDVERYFSHTWGAGLVETGRRMGEFFSALSQHEMISDVLVADGEFVVHRASWRASHIGRVIGVEASAHTVEFNDVEMWRVENGKIVEHWGGIGEAWHLYDQITGDG